MKRTIIAIVLSAGLALAFAPSAAVAAQRTPARATQSRPVLRTAKLVSHSLRANCWRSDQITVTEKNSLGQAMYHVVMNPVTWCAGNGKITDFTYNKGTAAPDRSPWAFDRWLHHGKVDGGIGAGYVHFREDAQFKADLHAIWTYGHVYADVYFYTNGTYSGNLGGN